MVLTLDAEQELLDQGARLVVGVDEVGRGSWAGPLMVAAVVPGTNAVPKEVKDSKKIPKHHREEARVITVEWAAGWAVGSASAEECDMLGMSVAQTLATRRAFDQLEAQFGVPVDAAVVDGPWNFTDIETVFCSVKGDSKHASVAAASVIAKTARDALMVGMSEWLPWWSFELNKGYPSPAHRTALNVYGPSSEHRTSWSWTNHLPFSCRKRERVWVREPGSLF